MCGVLRFGHRFRFLQRLLAVTDHREVEVLGAGFNERFAPGSQAGLGEVVLYVVCARHCRAAAWPDAVLVETARARILLAKLSSSPIILALDTSPLKSLP